MSNKPTASAPEPGSRGGSPRFTRSVPHEARISSGLAIQGRRRIDDDLDSATDPSESTASETKCGTDAGRTGSSTAARATSARSAPSTASISTPKSAGAATSRRAPFRSSSNPSPAKARSQAIVDHAASGSQWTAEPSRPLSASRAASWKSAFRSFSAR